MNTNIARTTSALGRMTGTPCRLVGQCKVGGTSSKAATNSGRWDRLRRLLILVGVLIIRPLSGSQPNVQSKEPYSSCAALRRGDCGQTHVRVSAGNFRTPLRLHFGRFDREVVLDGFALLEWNGEDPCALPLEQRKPKSRSRSATCMARVQNRSFPAPAGDHGREPRAGSAVRARGHCDRSEFPGGS